MQDHVDKNVHAVALGAIGASKGGKARAAALTQSERSAIGKKGASARWLTHLVCETHTGQLEIGGIRIECAVLQDGTRVLSLPGVNDALGYRKKGANSSSDSNSPQPPHFLSSRGINRHVTSELMARMESPLQYRSRAHNRPVYGYEATLLPQICEAILKARDAGDLKMSQQGLAGVADLLVRGLAQVAIVALVDEATGYQSDRSRDALAKILEQFITNELQKWVSTFPADFYKEMFRLRGWSYSPLSMARPGVVAKYTNDIVYRRLAPGVLEELRRVTPKTDDGKLKARLHQSLTTTNGHPRLREHLAATIALMRVAPDWETFMSLIDRALPRFENTPALPEHDD